MSRKRFNFRRPLSLFLAASMMFTNLAGTGIALANELETEIMAQSVSEQIVVQTEVVREETKAVQYDITDYVYETEAADFEEEKVAEYVAIYIGDGKVVEECSPEIGHRIVGWKYRSDCVGAARYLPTFDGTVSLTGNDNLQKIWFYLRKTLGCSRAASAGILGNIYAESGYDAKALEPNGVGHGIIQWSWDRWYGSDGLQKFAAKHGRNWQDLALQLAFLNHEAVENNSMSAYYPGGFQKYKALTRVDGDGGTAHVFFYSFEYGSYVSYGTFISDEFENNFATRSKRLRIAQAVYNNRGTYP